MKLFRVRLRGMTHTVLGTAYGAPYIVAPDANTAYTVVRKYLDEKGIGYRHEREMESVELLAEEGDYPGCRVQLFLPKEVQRYFHHGELLEKIYNLVCRINDTISSPLASKPTVPEK